jgi:hypothetical protein
MPGSSRLRRAEGKNAAVPWPNKFYEDADKESKRIWGALTNEDQKRAFTKLANEELTQSKKIGEVQVGQQIAVVREQEFHGANAISMKRATDFATVSRRGRGGGREDRGPHGAVREGKGHAGGGRDGSP